MSSIDYIFKLQAENTSLIQSTEYKDRIKKINLIIDWVYENSDAIRRALKDDLSKPNLETDITEIWVTIDIAKDITRNLKRWMRPIKVSSSLPVLLAKSSIEYYPKGLCLIIAPWNYPFQLCIAPLLYAIAAGNCSVIKPSESTPSTSALIARMIRELFNEREVAVIEGDKEQAKQLLDKPFNHIFFTGNHEIGQKILQASSKHLSTTTLELGGKSPVVIDKAFNLNKVINRIISTKFINLGQTCIAPDYIIVHKDDYHNFIDQLVSSIKKVFGDDMNSQKQSGSLARIVNRQHFDRLLKIINDNKDSIVFGGEADDQELFISPTVVDARKINQELQRDEIFGPILPVFMYSSDEELNTLLKGIDNPLSIYIFSNKNYFIEKIKTLTSSGAICINDIAAQFLNHNLPFGGVMRSGSGRYHGFSGFKEFSNQRSVIHQSRINFLSMLSPPHTQKIKKLVNILLRIYKKI